MEIEFRIFNSYSLKDKRATVKSIVDKTKRIFNVSVSEVGENDMINYAIVGYSSVSNSIKVIESTFDKILDFYNNNYDIEVVSVRREIL